MPDQDHYHYDDDATVNSVTHHEISDVATKPLLLFFASFIVFSVFMYVVVYGLYQVFVHMERADNTARVTDMQQPASMKIPPEPRLQPFPTEDAQGNEVIPPNRNTPVTDLADMRKGEQDALDNYAWIDQQRGIVRVPIAVAKRLVLQRGFPVEPAAVTAANSSNVSPTVQPATDNAPRNPTTEMQQGDGNAASIEMTQRSGSSSTAAATATLAVAPAVSGSTTTSTTTAVTAPRSPASASSSRSRATAATGTH